MDKIFIKNDEIIYLECEKQVVLYDLDPVGKCLFKSLPYADGQGQKEVQKSCINNNCTLKKKKDALDKINFDILPAVGKHKTKKELKLLE